MLIVLGLYALLMWLIFSKFKLLNWNRGWKTVVYSGAFIIALVVIGALNYQTPSASVSIQGPMVGITPNVSGSVISVDATAHTQVKEGDVLFRIDDTTYAAEVTRLEAALIAARTSEAQLQTNLEAASAEIARLEAQLVFGNQRRDDIVQLSERGASSGFQMQEAVSTIDQLVASLTAAKARKAEIELRIASQVDGVDTGVIEVEQLLVQARWKLEETIVRAPSDGIITAVSLRTGNRVTPLRAAMNFFPNDDRVMSAVFPQSSAHGLKPGDTVRVALRTLPGSVFETNVTDLPVGTGEGTVDARERLPGLRDLIGGTDYVAILQIPDDLPAEAIRLGTTGTALRITDDAGGVKVLAEILFWVSKMMNYI